MVRPLVAYDPGDDLVSKSSEWIWHPDSEIGNTITSPKHGASIGNIFPSVLTCACFQSSEKQVFRTSTSKSSLWASYHGVPCKCPFVITNPSRHGEHDHLFKSHNHQAPRNKSPCLGSGNDLQASVTGSRSANHPSAVESSINMGEAGRLPYQMTLGLLFMGRVTTRESKNLGRD